ncbi:MAG: flagellar filament capping protein FliD [Treponema sp.]|nr:flagellar filament capping protein FliD [Treponema sp.]
MADISIPGVSNKYKTNEYIDALIKKERIPLTREQESLDRYKEQQSAWRGVNQKMSALRESTKALYSFENPFNNKLASSSDEGAITADAGREAAYGSIKVDVIKPATADRFLSGDLDKDSSVPQGTYTFEVDEKKISINWRGGKLTDFVNSINRRGTNIIKASLVGVSNEKQSLLVESLKTGNKSNLIFRDAALSYALKIGLIEKTKAEITEFGTDRGELTNPPEEQQVPEVEQEGLPAMTADSVAITDGRITLPPRSGFSIPVSKNLLENEGERLEFSFATEDVTDITEELNIKRTTRPELPEAGKATYDEITVRNNPSDTSLPPVPLEPLVPVENSADFYVHNSDGSEIKINTKTIAVDTITGEKKISLQLKKFPNIDSIVVRNRNTGEAVSVSSFSAFDEKKNLGYSPVHPASVAGDAVIKYEGITITRPENKIDDIVPHVTLNIHDATERTATIKIEPDKEAAKDALINFVGTYNQVIAEMNILSQNKPEIVTELDYLSKDEQDAANERLGMFAGDFSLTNSKASMQAIVSANYRWSEAAVITMLSQIGISTRASSGGGSGYSASQLRGYLEIDEKKLDQSLNDNLEYIKNIFGYDSDGDLIVDSGIGFALDKQLGAWVSTGGIISNKDKTLAQRITASETTIRKLESQLANKEQQLKDKYGQMEGTLNSLQAQSNTISNFANGGRQQ